MDSTSPQPDCFCIISVCKSRWKTTDISETQGIRLSSLLLFWKGVIAYIVKKSWTEQTDSFVSISNTNSARIRLAPQNGYCVLLVKKIFTDTYFNNIYKRSEERFFSCFTGLFIYILSKGNSPNVWISLNPLWQILNLNNSLGLSEIKTWELIWIHGRFCKKIETSSVLSTNFLVKIQNNAE